MSLLARFLACAFIMALNSFFSFFVVLLTFCESYHGFTNNWSWLYQKKKIHQDHHRPSYASTLTHHQTPTPPSSHTVSTKSARSSTPESNGSETHTLISQSKEKKTSNKPSLSKAKPVVQSLKSQAGGPTSQKPSWWSDLFTDSKKEGRTCNGREERERGREAVEERERKREK